MAFSILFVRLVISLAAIEANFASFKVNGDVSCTWGLNGAGDHTTDPLYLHPQRSNNKGNVNTDMRKFWLPNNDDGNMEVPNNENILLACPREKLILQAQQLSTKSLLCKDGKFYSQISNINDIKCFEDEPGITTKTLPTSCGGGSGKIITVGYEVDTAGFFEIMNICFNLQQLDAIYSHFVLVPEIKNMQRGDRAKRFEQLDFFPRLNVESLYSIEEQENTFMRIIGSKEPYLQQDQFLTRGHLTAFQDYAFYAHRLKTFIYINVAPQWKSINSGNWEHLEEKCHRYSKTYQKTLQVYTGTKGVLSLKHTRDGSYKEIFLEPKNKIKVPKYFWRVVYDEASKQGVAFIMSNNPFETEREMSKLCQSNICSKLHNWKLTWDPTIVVKGEVICCEVNDPNIKQTVKEFPNLSIKGLLN